MAKILTFRHKFEIGAGSGDGIGAEGFLQDGDDTLPFRTTPEGRTGLGELTMSPRQGGEGRAAGPRSNWSDRDWSNQELADLFRVKRLLDAAGVPSEIDRGLTDEGDPWFVFCGADAEVFIHLCRIDGLYVLDSPNVARPLRGVDFNALIADFTNRAVPRSPGEAAPEERRVIRLERGGKVRLHPSALLAALIWTLFLASEELVLMAPEEGGETDRDGNGLDALAGLGALEGPGNTEAPVLASDILNTARAEADPRETAREGYSPEADLALRELQGQQGLALHQNGYALGLSTLAIAMGIMSETVFTDDRRKILDALQGADLALLAGEAEAETPEAGAEANAVAALLGEIEAFLDVVLKAGARESAESDDRPAMTEDALAFLDLLKAAARDAAEGAMTAEMPERKAPEAALADLPAQPGEEIAPEAAPAPRPVAEIAPPPAAEPVLFTGFSLQDIVTAWTPALEEFTLDGAKVMASFDLTDDSYAGSDIAELIAAPVLDVTPDTPSGMAEFAGATRAQEFDAQAQAFLEAYVFAEGHKFEMISFGSGVTLLDTEVLQAPEGSAYRMEWEMENGKTFSLIGLRSEFQDFDLIA